MDTYFYDKSVIKAKEIIEMEKMLLLMKNGSIKMKRNITKYYDDIKYILFKADSSSDTFVLHKPLKYMKTFTKAKVYIETYVRKVMNDVQEYQFQECVFTKMGSTIKELNSLEEFIKYLASLSRITYSNKLVKSNDCMSYELIEFSFFKVELFCNDKLVYEKELNIENQKGYFDTRMILDNISIIYDAEEKSAKYLNIDLNRNQWSMDLAPKKHHLCGVYLIYTRTFVFLDFDSLHYIRKEAKSLYIRTITFNKEEFDGYELEREWEYIETNKDFDYKESKLFYSCHIYDLWIHEDVFILEFITYLPYTYMTIQTISEINDLGKTEGKYDSESYIELEYFDHRIPEKHIVSTSKKPLTFQKLIEVIKEGDKLCI